MTTERPPLASRPAALGPHRLGATPLSDHETRFVVWAPGAASVQLVLTEAAPIALAPLGSGYHGTTAVCSPGTRYRYVLDGGQPLADPASRLQPDGVLGPSEVVDLGAYEWQDADYRPPPLVDYVISECHVGAFTREGTFDAARAELDRLVDVGLSAVELMPVAQFPGRRNWGYDGVFPFAVQHSYGGPRGLQRLVDACHERGLAVILDVVHNHLGPVGNMLGSFGPYFTDRYRTPWGPALNFDGAESDHVRTFFLQSVAQWFVDFHIDALRLDAIHAIADTSATPFVIDLTVLADVLAEELARPCPLIAESAANDPRVVTARDAGGNGMAAQWNDDFHHALHAALTGERQGYYVDFGALADVARAMNGGFVYQGEYSVFRHRRHGAASVGLDPERFVVFAQNHDHIGNRPRGERLTTLLEPAQVRLAAAVLLLAPGLPLLFMGEEYGETAPFPFFVDYGDPELAQAVRTGRRADLRAMGYDEEPLDPSDDATFARAVIDPSVRDEGEHGRLLELHRRLIALRRELPALRRSVRRQVETSVAGPVLTLVRRHPAGSVAALFNVSAAESEVVTPELGPGPRPTAFGAWRRILDSGDPERGEGPAAPESPAPGDAIRLAPWAFCLYGSEPGAPVRA
jgi:maltooligosyltrehalose trehalohydrolase